MSSQLNQASTAIKAIQTNMLHALESITEKINWQETKWDYQAGTGGGLTIVCENNKIIEKAGVNFSNIANNKIIESATVHRPELKGASFQACGTSIIVHPDNPFAPTTHANFRYFQAKTVNNEILWWFGGGFDLTPYYVFTEDCIQWHQAAYNLCETYEKGLYQKYKTWCDNYFYLKHRQEPRGIGGIFFDNLNHWDFSTCLSFIEDGGEAFIKTYTGILSRRKATGYTSEHKNFQLYRRGRYVEFNLLYDRGTKFGLESNGRTESILISLPPQVTWATNNNSYEKDLLNYFNNKNWLNNQ